MPTPAEHLWESLKKKEFDGIQALIEAHPEENLINAVHAEYGHNLAIHLLLLIQTKEGKKDDKLKTLLNFVLTHPELNWAFVNNLQTSVSCLITATWGNDDCTFIEALNNTPGFIFNGEKLAYDVAVKALKGAENLQRMRIKANKPAEDLEKSVVSVARYQKMVDLIRDISILYAIKMDDDVLMERLHKSGADIRRNLGEFGNKTMPALLFGRSQPNPKLSAWIKKAFEAENAQNEERMQALAEQLERNRFFQAQADKINQEHDEKRVEILSRAGEDRQGRIASIISIIKKI